MRVTGLKDGVNTGDFPDIRDSASDVRSRGVSAYDFLSSSRILVELWIRERTSELEQDKQERVEVKFY